MPTTNPVPSQDPSDLLFNAGKLDEVLNGTGTSFTDRLGTARRTVAGMNADFDAQLSDAESDLNVYRADAAASAAEALGYLQTIRATSYGAYASDPATDPLGNPPTAGDEYFNTTSNLLKRWNGATWQASDINTANLAAPSGSSLVGYATGTVQDVLDTMTGPTGAASVGYTPAGTGAVATTVQSKLRETVSVLDFKCADGFPVQGNGTHDDTTGIKAAIEHAKTLKSCTVIFPQTGSDYIVTAPIKLYSNVRIVAEHGTNFIGPYQNNKPGIKKTTNTTVAITNFDTGAVYNVDCIFYTEFALFAGVDYSSGAAQDFYPQQFVLKNLLLKGGAPLPVTTGLHMDFGSNMVMDGCDAIGVTHAFYGRNIFVSKLHKVRTSGKITVSQSATSLILDNCSARNGFYLQGAYYSSLRACTSDEGSGQSAYTFVSCHGVTIDACGAEKNAPDNAQTGVFNFASGNHSMVMINPVVGHAVGSTSPAVSVGDFDRVVVVGGDFGLFASDAPSAYDVYGGSNSSITFLNTKFIGSDVLSDPIAATLVGGTYPSICTYEYNGVRKVKTSTKEYINGSRSGTWNPVLQFGGGNTGVAGTFTGEWREDGNTLVAHGYIDLTAKGTSTGAATITMPASNGFSLPAGGGPKFGIVTFASQSNVTSRIEYGAIVNAGTVTAQLLGDTGVSLTDAIFTNTTRLRFRIEMPLV